MKYININHYLLLIPIYLIRINYSIIVFPFEISKPNKNDESSFSFEEFFSSNLLIDFYTTIYIGNENKKVLGRISTLSHVFTFSEKECHQKSLEQNFDYSIVTKSGYPLYESTSYKNVTKESQNFVISEIFSLYNTTHQSSIPPSLPNGNFLEQNKLIDMKKTVNDMNIMLKTNNNNLVGDKFCILIGLNSPYIRNNNNNEIYLINELKRLEIINDYSWTLNFFSSGAGQLIIGGLPHNYMEKKEFYQKKQFIEIKSNSINDVNLPWSIVFDNIFFENYKKEEIYIQKNAKCYLVPNIGFIIGTLDYKKYISENYFDFFWETKFVKLKNQKKLVLIMLLILKRKFLKFSLVIKMALKKREKIIIFPT